MSSNIHGFDTPSNRRVGIQSSNSISGSDDRIFIPSIYKIRTVTCFLLVLNVAIYLFQVLAFYLYYERKGNSWSCLLVRFGAFNGGKIKNHYQFYRFLTAMFLHNSIAHMGSNCLSLFFLGFQTESEIKNKFHYAILYFISGLMGNFASLIFTTNSIGVGASGAIIGLCGNFVIYFLLNYRRMSERKKYSYGTMFIMLFINLFSGLSEGGENINMAAHIGGFLGGFAFSVILTVKKNSQYLYNNPSAKTLYYCSIIFLILFPIISISFIVLKNVENNTDYICKFL